MTLLRVRRGVAVSRTLRNRFRYWCSPDMGLVGMGVEREQDEDEDDEEEEDEDDEEDEEDEVGMCPRVPPSVPPVVSEERTKV